MAHRNGPDTRVVAVDHARRGWAVFPVLPDGKRPAIPDWPHRALTDPDVVRRVWPAGHNIGLACGPSKLVVVDLDVGKPLPPPWDARSGIDDGRDVFAALADEWPNTYTVATPSGGWHLYFTAGASEIRNSASQVGPLVDIRGAGGYVVAAGSVIDGTPYRVINPMPPMALPRWLVELATKPAAHRSVGPTPTVTTDVSDAYVRAAFEREVHAVATAWAGGRNNQLNRSAFALARFVAAGQLGHDVVVEALTAAGRHVGLGDHEIRATLRSALAARGVAA